MTFILYYNYTSFFNSHFLEYCIQIFLINDHISNAMTFSYQSGKNVNGSRWEGTKTTDKGYPYPVVYRQSLGKSFS